LQINIKHEGCRIVENADFAKMLASHDKSMARYARYLARGEADADDLFQDTHPFSRVLPDFSFPGGHSGKVDTPKATPIRLRQRGLSICIFRVKTNLGHRTSL
jgi:hypothetical protein